MCDELGVLYADLGATEDKEERKRQEWSLSRLSSMA